MSYEGRLRIKLTAMNLNNELTKERKKERKKERNKEKTKERNEENEISKKKRQESKCL